MLPELQRDFARGLFAPRCAPVLERILGEGIDPARRLFVHYNTVARSLSQVLARGYPALLVLLGKPGFDAAAGRYIRNRPPRDAALIFYGEGFGPFAAEAAPGLAPELVRGIADIEWAQKQAFHAADAPLLTNEALRAIPPDAVAGMRCIPHPALRLCASPAPAVQVWRTALAEDGAAARRCAAEASGPSRVAVTRPAVAPQVSEVAAGHFALLAALAQGATVQSALERALAADAGFDPASGLAAIAGLPAFTAVEVPEGEQIHDEGRD